MPIEFTLTQKEKDLLYLLTKGRNLREACKELGVSLQTGSQRLRRIRDRYLRAREFIEEYERFRSKLPTKYI
jgi:DNA-directed RNA polymerase specialized sigma24 family protein